MAQRHICPSLGMLRRPIGQDLCRYTGGQLRAIHNTASRCEEQPTKPASSKPGPPTRKERSATALRQITNLQNQRQPPSGQAPRFNLRTRPNQNNAATENGTSPPRFARRTTPPPGQMARGPRMTPNFAARGPRGPNLSGRDFKGRGPGGARKPQNKDKKDGPQKRDKRKTVNRQQDQEEENLPESETMTDGDVLALLRLQRKEWDRTPYEPKYMPGSFAANELIHTGRELFRGESPPVKIWGPLERRIGVVGMHGAEATLKIRRVGDGDAEPFGEELPEPERPERKSKQA